MEQPSTNRAAVLTAARTIELQDLALPSSPPPGHVLVNVIVSGICGSDLHRYQLGNAAFEGKPASADKPVIMGHESAGVVRQLGEGVTAVKVGQRCILEPMMPCFRCAPCCIGRHNLCRDGSNVSMIGSPNGFLTQWATVPVRNAIPLPENLSWDEAGCLQPLAIAVHAARRARIGPHQSVAIFGAGPVGLFVAAVAKAYGASKIIMFDISDVRLAMAKRTVATHVFTSTSPPADGSVGPLVFVREEAARICREAGVDLAGVDVVVEASAAASAMRQGVALVKAGGTYLQVGLGQGEMAFPMRMLAVKEIDVLGVIRYSLGSFEAAIDLVVRGLVDLKPFVTKRLPLSKTGEALEELRKGENVKIVIYNNEL